MIQPVDVGEATIGVLGVVDVLSGKADVSATARNAVSRFPKTINDMAKQLVRGETFKAPYRSYDQKKFAKLLSGNPSEYLEHVAESPWIEHAAAIGQALRLRNILDAARPKSQLQGLLGVKVLPVSSFEWHAFEDVISLLNDPLTIFQALACGRITHKLTGVFVQANRSIYEAVAGSVATCAIDEFVKAPATYQLPAQVEASLSTFLSVDGIGDKISAAIGTPKQQGQKGKPPSNVEHGAGLSFAPKSNALDGQK